MTPAPICPPLPLAGRLPARLDRWAAFFEEAGTAHGVDPFILAAICDRESLGGDALSPPGPGGTGDHGHGRGLLQIDDRAWPDFCRQVDADGAPLWADAEANILQGAMILRLALDALALDYPSAICAYNAGVGNAKHALSSLNPSSSEADKVAALDQRTTGHNYVSDVLARRDKFLATDPDANS